MLYRLLGSIPTYLGEFAKFTDIYAKGLAGFQYNHSILFGIYYFLYKFLNIDLSIVNNSIYNIYTIAIIIIAITLIIYAAKREMPEWKRLTLIVLMMISFPQVSFDYTLILLIIPIIVFIADNKTKKWENIIYSILFGFLFIPMNWNEEKIKYIFTNIGLLVKPMIIIVIMTTIVMSTTKKK